MRKSLSIALAVAILVSAGPAQAADSIRDVRSQQQRTGDRARITGQLQNDLSLAGLNLDLGPELNKVELQEFLDARTPVELERLHRAAVILSMPWPGVPLDTGRDSHFMRTTLPVGRAQALTTLYRAIDGVSDADLVSGKARERIAANFSRLLGENSAPASVSAQTSELPVSTTGEPGRLLPANGLRPYKAFSPRRMYMSSMFSPLEIDGLVRGNAPMTAVDHAILARLARFAGPFYRAGARLRAIPIFLSEGLGAARSYLGETRSEIDKLPIAHEVKVAVGDHVLEDAARYRADVRSIEWDARATTLVERFKEQSGWRVDWIAGDRVLVDSDPDGRRLILNLGWVVTRPDTAQMESRRALLRAVLAELVGAARRHDQWALPAAAARAAVESSRGTVASTPQTQAPVKRFGLAAWRELGRSYHQFVFGESMFTGASIAMAIVIPAYAMANFGIAIGVAGQLINITARIIGSKWGAQLVTRLRSRGINEKTLYIANLVLQVGNIGAFVGAYFALGGGHWGYAAMFLFQQVIHGLGNGAIDNMAANSIKPRIVGTDRGMLERANFASQAGRGIASLLSGLLVSKIIMGQIVPEIQILIYAGLQLASVYFFRKVTLKDDAAPAAAGATLHASVPKLPWRDYLPVIATQFATSTFWTLFSSAFAIYVFNAAAVNGHSITAHLAGAALFSLALVGMKDKLSALFTPKTWLGLLVAADAAWLVSGVMGLWWIYVPSAFALGALININQGKWMAYYQSRVPGHQIGALSAFLAKWGMGLAALPLAAVGAAKIAGAAVVPILWGAVAITLAVQIGLWVFSRGGREP